MVGLDAALAAASVLVPLRPAPCLELLVPSWVHAALCSDPDYTSDLERTTGFEPATITLAKWGRVLVLEPV
jgi:hypothetical protein